MVDQPSTPFQDMQLVHDGGCVNWFPRFQSLFKHAGTVDDASKSPTQDVQQSTNARQKEYRSDRKLNEVRDLVNLIHEHLRL